MGTTRFILCTQRRMENREYIRQWVYTRQHVVQTGMCDQLAQSHRVLWFDQPATRYGLAVLLIPMPPLVNQSQVIRKQTVMVLDRTTMDNIVRYE